MDWIDSAAAGSLFPLAFWILVSGLDDLFVLAVWASGYLRSVQPAAAEADPPPAERRIAIFLPLWREDRVVAGMLEHNLSAIRYRNYDFFVGAYPNDLPTQDAVRGVARRFANLHLCLCPHPGPTSKADCLNWIHQRMLRHEQETGARFEIILTHDAEDLIAPDALAFANRLIGRYHMVQTPVLPLPTRWQEWTHGLYCDDFAEMHTKDLAVRGRLSGFIPSCGVGTAYSREAIDRLAASGSRVFEPECLTEDYENGLRLHRMGLAQLFLPVALNRPAPLATREYFPRTFRAALAQRTRWVTGIALQSWQRHGWGRDPRQWYWLWRDRKGLLGCPLSLYANVLFFYGLASFCLARWQGAPWGLGMAVSGLHSEALLTSTASLCLLQLAVRTACSAGVYGIPFALFVPYRLLFGNLLNSLAVAGALLRFGAARFRNTPLSWAKTEHCYPSLEALSAHGRPLEEILVSAGYVDPARLAAAAACRPAGTPLPAHLVRLGILVEEQLTRARSLQSGLPAETVDPVEVSPRVARALPAWLQKAGSVIAVRVENGQLHLAGPFVPDSGTEEELRKHTRLKLRFVLVTQDNYRRLFDRLLAR